MWMNQCSIMNISHPPHLKILVQPAGIEPASPDLQSGAMTTSAKVA